MTKRYKNHNNKLITVILKKYAMKQDPLGTYKKTYMRRQGTVQRQKAYRGHYVVNVIPNDYAKAKICQQ